MDAGILALIASLSGTLVGGLITYIAQRQRFKQELELLKQQQRTEYMAEETVKHFLSHQGYTDRQFDTIAKHLGGFGDDELRKILVRAGAIRTYRADGSEWWRLLSRMDEYIQNKTGA
jgi:lipopolysaccharide export system protein LptC